MRQLSATKQLLGLIGWLVLSFIAAAIGSLASRNAGSFYEQLTRPEWAPSSSVFGPVWAVLYFLMGIAAWLIWRKQTFREAGAALGFFIAQLVANALWSWLFFAWRKGAAAFADIVLLWLLILATIIAFWRIRPVAAALLFPYLAWVTYATALCFFLWQNNPDLLT